LSGSDDHRDTDARGAKVSNKKSATALTGATEGGGAFGIVVPPAPGGTLSEYAAHLASRGLPCAVTASGTQVWTPGARGELVRFPLECTEEVDRSVRRSLLKRRGVWMASYLLEADHASGIVPNCFDYVCRNSHYVIDTLPKNARRDIRRGQRSFEVRLCSWDELAERGFAAHADTAARHGYSAPPADEVRRMVNNWRESPCHEVWGAWQDDELSAWMVVVKIDDWGMINVVRSCTAVLKGCPNNAVLYEATRRLLAEEKRTYVTYGLSSIQVNVGELSMHKYKVRMGYEALPVHRRFVVHPVLRPLVTARPVAWSLERLAGIMPGNKNLRRLAGMARLVSGREKAPLTWASEVTDPGHSRSAATHPVDSGMRKE
jgi:hypothetical protein